MPISATRRAPRSVMLGRGGAGTAPTTTKTAKGAPPRTSPLIREAGPRGTSSSPKSRRAIAPSHAATPSRRATVARTSSAATTHSSVTRARPSRGLGGARGRTPRRTTTVGRGAPTSRTTSVSGRGGISPHLFSCSPSTSASVSWCGLTIVLGVRRGGIVRTSATSAARPVSRGCGASSSPERRLFTVCRSGHDGGATSGPHPPSPAVVRGAPTTPRAGTISSGSVTRAGSGELSPSRGMSSPSVSGGSHSSLGHPSSDDPSLHGHPHFSWTTQRVSSPVLPARPPSSSQGPRTAASHGLRGRPTSDTDCMKPV